MKPLIEGEVYIIEAPEAASPSLNAVPNLGPYAFNDPPIAGLPSILSTAESCPSPKPSVPIPVSMKTSAPCQPADALMLKVKPIPLSRVSVYVTYIELVDVP